MKKERNLEIDLGNNSITREKMMELFEIHNYDNLLKGIQKENDWKNKKSFRKADLKLIGQYTNTNIDYYLKGEELKVRQIKITSKEQKTKTFPILEEFYNKRKTKFPMILDESNLVLYIDMNGRDEDELLENEIQNLLSKSHYFKDSFNNKGNRVNNIYVWNHLNRMIQEEKDRGQVKNHTTKTTNLLNSIFPKLSTYEDIDPYVFTLYHISYLADFFIYNNDFFTQEEKRTVKLNLNRGLINFYNSIFIKNIVNNKTKEREEKSQELLKLTRKMFVEHYKITLENPEFFKGNTTFSKEESYKINEIALNYKLIKDTTTKYIKRAYNNLIISIIGKNMFFVSIIAAANGDMDEFFSETKENLVYDMNLVLLQSVLNYDYKHSPTTLLNNTLKAKITRNASQAHNIPQNYFDIIISLKEKGHTISSLADVEEGKKKLSDTLKESLKTKKSKEKLLEHASVMNGVSRMSSFQNAKTEDAPEDYLERELYNQGDLDKSTSLSDSVVSQEIESKIIKLIEKHSKTPEEYKAMLNFISTQYKEKNGKMVEKKLKNEEMKLVRKVLKKECFQKEFFKILSSNEKTLTLLQEYKGE